MLYKIGIPREKQLYHMRCQHLSPVDPEISHPSISALHWLFR